MAEDKRSFIFYSDWLEGFEDLTDKEAGQLIKHILRYVNDEDPELEDRVLRAYFMPIKNQLKRDLQKWGKIREKRSEAGKKSAEKRAEQKATNPTHVKSVETISTNPTVTVNDNVTVNVNDNVIKSKPPKKAGGKFNYVDSVLEIWKKKYLEKRGFDYEVATIGKERSALGKIIRLNKKKFPGLKSDEALESLGVLFEMCLNINDNWLSQNMSPSIIISKYNEIKTILTNGKSKGNTGQGASDESIARIWAEAIASQE